MATELLGICQSYDVLLKAKSMKPKTLFLVCLIVFLLTSFLVSISFFVAPVHANPDTLTLRPNAVGTYSQFVEVPNSGFLFGDQFESGTTTLWTAKEGTLSVVTTPVYDGTHSLKATGAKSEVSVDFASGYADFYLRLYVQFSSLPTTDGSVAALTAFYGTAWDMTLQAIIQNQTGTVYFGIIQQVSGITYLSTTTVSTNTWYCVEVRLKTGTGNAICSLYVNGNLIINKTTETITEQSQHIYCGLTYGTVAGIISYTDSVVMGTSYIGPEARYNLVNDASDNTALQVTSNTTEKEIELLATTSQTGTINSVTVDMRAKASTTSRQAVTVTRTHNTDYEGAATTISNTAFTDYTTVYGTNPNTSVAWTWAEVNALEVGARASTLSSGTIQFSEFYVTVTYTSDVTAPTYSSISTNTTLANNPCSFNCLVNDDTDVSTYIFSTNNTGAWTNDTATPFSNFFNTTTAWANVTKTLNDTVGNVVSYVWYANDTSNNWSSSDQYNLTLTAPYRPSLQMTPDNVTCRIYLETFSVQINVTNGIDTQAFNFTIYYDPQVLNCSSVSWGELGTGTMTEIDTTNGILEGNVAGSPLNGNHSLLNITFQADKAIIWKNGLTNKLEGKIWFHQAQLNFTDNSTLQYIEGGINQIDVNQAAYTFLPIQGDVNNDGTVDIIDIRIIAFYYGKTPADPEWPAASKYDLTNDNTIDIFDLRLVAANFGFTYP